MIPYGKNVAFGVPEERIDETRVWEVLREAQLDEFVKTLPEGLDTGIGERGIRLSGGQRQRIGIARATRDLVWCSYWTRLLLP